MKAKTDETLRTENEIKFNLNLNEGNVLKINPVKETSLNLFEQVEDKDLKEFIRILLRNAWQIKQRRSKRGTKFYETYIERPLTFLDLDDFQPILGFNMSYYQASKSARAYYDYKDCQNFIQIYSNKVIIITERGTGRPKYQTFKFENLKHKGNEFVNTELMRKLSGIELSHKIIKNDKY